MEVQFLASTAPIVRDLEAARAFYQGALGLSLEGGGGDGYTSENKSPRVRRFSTAL
jgi:catechol 2,3-dioxygenase-like lactoylglutathione lyase family enzyme